MEFFMSMIPPTTTAQQHKISTRGKRPVVYQPAELKDARAKLEAHLAQYRPECPMTAGVQLVVKWCFPSSKRHSHGTYRTTRPDTDNLQKLLKDCMTRLGYWVDDAQVACEVVEKFWSDTPGIYVKIDTLGAQDDGV